eukprot:GCRY01004058.1.p1 GENE.GCRY01004058.1~~GCRY01004058.1.p1  ORF type:complete len:381 (+),score=93.82 GCRY01004058.1:259-1401(+)
MNINDIVLRYQNVCTSLQVTPLDNFEAFCHSSSESKVSVNLAGNQSIRFQNRLTDPDIMAICETFENSKVIEDLNLSYNRATNSAIPALCRLLNSETTLSSLNLSYNDIEEEGCQSLCEALGSPDYSGALAVLEISGNRLRKGGGRALANLLQENITLTRLGVADCALDTDALIFISAALTTNRSLLSIDLSKPVIFSHQHESLQHISRMLAVNPVLQQLTLKNHNIDCHAFQHLKRALLENSSLTHLNISRNKIVHGGLDGLLQKNGSLQAVDLSFNALQDQVALDLADVLMDNTALQSLNVAHNNLTDVGMIALCSSLEGNTALREFKVWGNKIGNNGALALERLLANTPVKSVDFKVWMRDSTACLAAYDGEASPLL